ncbi:MAG: hypothetical protein AAF548_08240 [Actinomycetota bacterium]
MVTPTHTTARMYDVGFGDCLLLTFHYRDDPNPIDGVVREERHMLVDFGSTRYPYSGFKLQRVTEAIAARTGGKLDVVVATHRHKDHVSGFGVKKPSEEIEAMKPGLIIRPWPDHPDATNDTRSPVGENDREFARQLRGIHTFAEAAVAEYGESRAVNARAISALADMGLANKGAIDNLVRWSRRSGAEAKYVVAGEVVDLAPRIPGVTMDILGPPSLDQVPGLTSQRADSPEYWLRGARRQANRLSGSRSFDDDVFDVLGGDNGIGAAAWLVRRLESRTAGQLLQIVRAFDDALNNTSIVALVNSGTSSMLVSGDAQIENWRHTLNRIKEPTAEEPNEAFDADLRERLARVDLYKIGHHGSRNGTPISMHELWTEHRDMRRKMTFLMSTKHGVHGHSAATAVPNPRLETAFKGVRQSRYYSTEDLRGRRPERPDEDQNYRAYVGSTSRTSGTFGRFEPEDAY